jgi:hypothetical protein
MFEHHYLLTTPAGPMLLSHNRSDMYDRWTRAMSPTAFWRFQDAGTTATDDIGSWNATVAAGATRAACPMFPTDQPANRMSFNGTTQYANAGALFPQVNAPTAITLEAIISWSDTSLRYVMCSATPSGATVSGIALYQQSGRIKALASYAAGVSQIVLQSSVLTTGTEYHANVTWNGTTMSLYVNGALVDSSTPGASLDVNSTGYFGIGARLDAAGAPYATPGYWYGTIAKAAVYPVCMTAAMIADRYIIASATGCPTSAGTSKVVVTKRPMWTATQRRTNDPYPKRDGARIGSAYDDEAVFIANGKMYGLGQSTAELNLTAVSQLEQAIRIRLASIRRADGTLKWAPRGFVPLKATVRRHERLDTPDGISAIKDYQMSLVSGDPMVYGYDASTVSLTPATSTGFTSPFASPFYEGSAGGEQTFTNAGDSSVYPVLTIYGPITTPVATNVTTGAALALTALTVADGQYVTIDTWAKTVLINGVTDGYAYFDASLSTMWSLAAGANVCRLAGTTTGANTRMTVTASPGWAAS